MCSCTTCCTTCSPASAFAWCQGRSGGGRTGIAGNFPEPWHSSRSWQSQLPPAGAGRIPAAPRSDCSIWAESSVGSGADDFNHSFRSWLAAASIPSRLALSALRAASSALAMAFCASTVACWACSDFCWASVILLLRELTASSAGHPPACRFHLWYEHQVQDSCRHPATASANCCVSERGLTIMRVMKTATIMPNSTEERPDSISALHWLHLKGMTMLRLPVSWHFGRQFGHLNRFLKHFIEKSILALACLPYSSCRSANFSALFEKFS